MHIKTVLFDLDGTITDSAPGIVNSVAYTLDKYGIPYNDKKELEVFIGPPLAKQFELFCGFSEEESYRAVDVYREYYSDRGIFENSVYEGIVSMLKRLKEDGYKVVVATSKPERMAKIIAEHFDIEKYFDFIGGAHMDGRRTDKKEVIEYVLANSNVSDHDEVIMVGDRKYDVIGAHELGIKCIAVLFGYGSKKELTEAGADYMAETPEKVADIIEAL